MFRWEINWGIEQNLNVVFVLIIVVIICGNVLDKYRFDINVLMKRR